MARPRFTGGFGGGGGGIAEALQQHIAKGTNMATKRTQAEISFGANALTSGNWRKTLLAAGNRPNRGGGGYAPPGINRAKFGPPRTGTAAKGGQNPRGGGRGGAPNKRIPGTTRRFMVNKKTGVARYTGTYDRSGKLVTGKNSGINARTGRTG